MEIYCLKKIGCERGPPTIDTCRIAASMGCHRQRGMNPSFAATETPHRVFLTSLFLADEKHNDHKDTINPDGLTTLRMPIMPKIWLLQYL